MNAQEELTRIMNAMQKEHGQVAAKAAPTPPQDVSDEELREWGRLFLEMMQGDDDGTAD